MCPLCASFFQHRLSLFIAFGRETVAVIGFELTRIFAAVPIQCSNEIQLNDFDPPHKQIVILDV